MTANMDLDYRNLSKPQIIRKYQRNLDILRNFARQNNISDDDFDRYVSEDIQRLPAPKKTLRRRLRYLKSAMETHKKILTYGLVFLLTCAFFFYQREVSAVLLRNFQVYIYPVMRLWRRLSAPLILFFPSLTELYDESCLVPNPYFHVEGLNCSPCSNVINILDLSAFDHLDINDSVPFMFRTDQREVTLRHFLDIYQNNQEVFHRDAFKVRSTNDRIKNLESLGSELLNKTNRPESHSVWRCNRMGPARLVRKYFPHPKRFPQTGTSLERFLLFDTPEAKAYRLPDPECPNAFLTQIRGNRKIVLMPTQECKSECRTLSIRLPTSYVLKYNWWYYRPISLPSDESQVDSVTYMGSYC